MITIKLDGIDQAVKSFELARRGMEIAAQRALLKTAHKIREAEQFEMKSVFDRPTPWTIGAMKVKPTAKMEVSVGILDPDGYYRRANNYLGTQVSGGGRRQKALEKSLQAHGIMPAGWLTVPGEGAKLDAFGNMGPGEIRQILSWFDAAENWAGSTQNMGQKGREKRRKGTRKTAGFEYFAVHPLHRNRGHNLMPGIYRRTFFGFGRAIKPILIFVRDADYKPRFDFERVARETAAKHFRYEFDAAIQIELGKQS